MFFSIVERKVPINNSSRATDIMMIVSYSLCHGTFQSLLCKSALRVFLPSSPLCTTPTPDPPTHPLDGHPLRLLIGEVSISKCSISGTRKFQAKRFFLGQDPCRKKPWRAGEPPKHIKLLRKLTRGWERELVRRSS